jgi:hypothetical protein
MGSLRVSCALMGILLPGLAFSSPITVPTGGEFIASSNSCIVYFACPEDAVMASVFTQPTAGTAGYSLQAWLISDATGTNYALPNNFFLYELLSGPSSEIGFFGYNGLMAGFPFPSDPAFFGPDPVTSTFSMLFQNTGLPFTFLSDQMDQSIQFNLISGGWEHSSLPTNSASMLPGPSSAPEPSPGVLAIAGILILLALRLPLRRIRARSGMQSGPASPAA